MLHTKFSKYCPFSYWEEHVNRRCKINDARRQMPTHSNRSPEWIKWPRNKINQSKTIINHQIFFCDGWNVFAMCVPVLRGPRKMTEVLSESKREATDMTLISPFADLPKKQTNKMVIKQRRKKSFYTYNKMKHQILTSHSCETTIPHIYFTQCSYLL